MRRAQSRDNLKRKVQTNQDSSKRASTTPTAIPDAVPGEIMTWLQMAMAAAEMPINVSFVFWQGQDFSFMADRENITNNLKIRINHPGVIGELINAPNLLRAVDLLIDGLIDYSGDIDSLISLFCRLYMRPIEPSDELRDWCKKRPSIDQPPEASPDWHKLTINSRERDKAVVQYHYDVSNDFYKLWLDPKMLYSCAHFSSPTDSLEAAQEAKLDLICRKLQLVPGDKFLDIGCGWGALIRFAVTHYGVEAHGITLSKEQLAFNQKWIAEAGLADKVKVELKDYRELPARPTYNKISSIGMIEHVGVANYTTYFRNALNALKPDGLFLNHGIALNQIWQPEVAFILKYIFPDAQCPPITTYLQLAKDNGFEIIDVDCWPPHYAMTLRAWAANLDCELEAATAIVGNRIKMWQIYLRFCAQGFENGTSSVYQTLLKRGSDGAWNLPLSRDNWLC